MDDFDIVFSSDLTEVEMEVERRMACIAPMMEDGGYCDCGYCNTHGKKMRSPIHPATFPMFRDLAGNLIRLGGEDNTMGFTYL